MQTTSYKPSVIFPAMLCRWLCRAVLAMLVLGVWAGCEKRESVDVQIQAEVSRAVSLAPSLTESLYAIGAGDKVVGVTTYCNYPAKADALPEIGGYTTPNYEAIFALKPDVAVMLVEHADAKDKLQRVGIASLSVKNGTLEDILESLRQMGEVFGHQDEAQALVQDIQSRMDTIAQKTSGMQRPRVLVSVGRNMGTGGLNQVFVAGQGTLYDQLIEAAGGVNAYQGDLQYAQMSQENIMRLAPDVVFDLIPDLDEAVRMTPEEVRVQWAALERVPAVENNRVYVFGEDYVCVPGPRFILVLERMARAMHSSVFANAEEVSVR